MGSRLIPRNQWTRELDSFSRSREGWIVRLAVTPPDGPTQIEARNLPLQGVTAGVDRDPVIAVMVGNRRDLHLTHEVRQPVELWLEETEAAAVTALVIRSADGTRTAVEFRSPMRPEEVDGMP
jgi:hypothetical protein